MTAFIPVVFIVLSYIILSYSALLEIDIFVLVNLGQAPMAGAATQELVKGGDK